MKKKDMDAIRKELLRLHKEYKFPKLAELLNVEGVSKDVLRHICGGENTTDEKAEALWRALFNEGVEEKAEQLTVLPEDKPCDGDVMFERDGKLVVKDLCPTNRHKLVGLTIDASDCIETIHLHTDKSLTDIASRMILFASKYIEWE